MNPLPDLSSWHPVPPGAVIPRGMWYARTTQDGFVYVITCMYDTTPASGVQYFTPTLLSPPQVKSPWVISLSEPSTSLCTSTTTLSPNSSGTSSCSSVSLMIGGRMSNLITDEMVEIAARAGWVYDWPDKPWESLPEGLADYYLSNTRASLEAVAPLIAAKAWEEGYAEGSRGRMWESTNPYQTHAEFTDINHEGDPT